MHAECAHELGRCHPVAPEVPRDTPWAEALLPEVERELLQVALRVAFATIAVVCAALLGLEGLVTGSPVLGLSGASSAAFSAFGGYWGTRGLLVGSTRTLELEHREVTGPLDGAEFALSVMLWFGVSAVLGALALLALVG